MIDAGAWDSLGDSGNQDHFDHISHANPASRLGTAKDVGEAVIFAMTNTFLTGVTLKIDGGRALT